MWVRPPRQGRYCATVHRKRCTSATPASSPALAPRNQNLLLLHPTTTYILRQPAILHAPPYRSALPEMGLEPVRPCGQGILREVRSYPTLSWIILYLDCGKKCLSMAFLGYPSFSSNNATVSATPRGRQFARHAENRSRDRYQSRPPW